MTYIFQTDAIPPIVQTTCVHAALFTVFELKRVDVFDAPSVSYKLILPELNLTALSTGCVVYPPKLRIVALVSDVLIQNAIDILSLGIFVTPPIRYWSVPLKFTQPVPITPVCNLVGGIASVWKIYVNTTDVSASVVNGPNNTNLPIQKTTVGVTYTNNALSNYLTADIDDLRVYNNVLTQGEIDELYGMKPFSGTQTSAYSNINSWWRIEETSGTTLADEKSTNPATLYNVSSFITFPSEGADSGSSSIKFDNTDMDASTASQGFAQMGVAGMTATDPISISLWVKASVTRNCVIWAFNADNYGTTTRLWWLDIRSSGKVTFMARNGNNTDIISSSSTNNNDGNWHHIVAVKTGNATSDSLKIYTDNILRGTDALNKTGGYAWPEWNDLKFGVSKHYNGNVPSRVYNWWAKDVQIDDVRVYTSAISNAQIAELYAMAP